MARSSMSPAMLLVFSSVIITGALVVVPRLFGVEVSEVPLLGSQGDMELAGRNQAAERAGPATPRDTDAPPRPATRTERRVLDNGQFATVEVADEGSGSAVDLAAVAAVAGGLVTMGGALGLGWFALYGGRREDEGELPARPTPAPIAPTPAAQLPTQLSTVDTAIGVPKGPERDVVPTVGGRYRLASKIGEGGMAAVYKALDLQTEQWVAVKVLLPQFADKKKIRLRFANEAMTMRRIEHPNVVKVIDVDTTGEVPWFVMEYARGGCLADWVEAHGAMPPRMAVDVVLQVAEGLAAAHAIGVVHRDMKPHNVLITAKGVCKVADFGIAQAQDKTSLTRTGSIMGTLGFMAPEQRQDAKGVDARADVYSLGATLYNMVTGRTVADLFRLEHDAALRDTLPAPLVDVVLESAAYVPDERYPTILDFADALRSARPALPEVPRNVPALVMETLEAPLGSELVAGARSQPTFPELDGVLHWVDHGAGNPTITPAPADVATRIRDDR